MRRPVHRWKAWCSSYHQWCLPGNNVFHPHFFGRPGFWAADSRRSFSGSPVARQTLSNRLCRFYRPVTRGQCRCRLDDSRPQFQDMCGEKAYLLTSEAEITQRSPDGDDFRWKQIVNEARNIVTSVHCQRCPPSDWYDREIEKGRRRAARLVYIPLFAIIFTLST